MKGWQKIKKYKREDTGAVELSSFWPWQGTLWVWATFGDFLTSATGMEAVRTDSNCNIFYVIISVLLFLKFDVL